MTLEEGLGRAPQEPERVQRADWCVWASPTVRPPTNPPRPKEQISPGPCSSSDLQIRNCKSGRAATEGSRRRCVKDSSPSSAKGGGRHLPRCFRAPLLRSAGLYLSEASGFLLLELRQSVYHALNIPAAEVPR